jgi:hopanoid biosynthesis associated RND transporter like protein HpnN
VPNNDKFNRCCQALVAVLKRGAWWVILISLALAVLSVNYAYHHLKFRTNRSDLVASDQRLLLLGEKLSQDFGSRDDLVVVVENGHPSRTKAFADALALELKKYPQEFPEIFYRLKPEALKKWALLYLEPGQIQEVKDRLQDHQALLAGLAANPSLTSFYQGVNHELTGSLLDELFVGFLDKDQKKEKVPDLSLLITSLKGLQQGLEGNKAYKSPLSGFFLKGMEDLDQEGYFLTANDKYLLFLVTPRKDGFSQAEHSVQLLRDIVARVETHFPGVKAGVTGPMALEADEMGSATADIALATWLSLAGQLLLLILFFRSIRRTLIEGLVLIVGLCWTFGLATLVVGHLNLLSIVFAPLMLGITIDFGVHWFCRLEEEQSHQGKTNGNTMNCTMQRAAPAIVYAALAAAASFVPLTLTGFKGLAELGVILAIGVILMLLATLTLLPSLVLVSERFTSMDKSQGCQGTPKAFLQLRWRHPALLVSAGLALAALGGLSLLHVKFDLNPLHLQNQKTESVVWEMKLMKNSRYSTAFGALTTKSLEDLQAKSAALKKLPTVSHVESILSFLPSQAEAKREQLATLAPLFQKISFPATLAQPSNPQELAGALGAIHFKLARALESDPNLAQVKEAEGLLGRIIPLLKSAGPQTEANLSAFEKKFFQDLRDKWDFLRDGVQSPLPRITDLPAEVRDRFISPQGTYLLRVFSAEDIWDPAPLGKFVKDLQRVDPDVSGDPVLLYYFTQAFRNACLWAAGIGLLVISFMLFGVFRSLKLTLLALIPLFVGTGWTLNLMWLLDIPFNQANVLFLPLILGEGIEFGIIILVRWQMEASTRVITLPASTAKGVLLAALTTTVGFGSLMVSGHQGTFSLGLLATVGSLSVLLASLSVLPAFLRLVEKRAAAPRTQSRLALDFKRLLFLMVGKEITCNESNLEDRKPT